MCFIPDTITIPYIYRKLKIILMNGKHLRVCHTFNRIREEGITVDIVADADDIAALYS